MRWTRSNTLALGMQSCVHCLGMGLRFGSRGRAAPCNCVLRAVFRICYEHFCYCSTKDKHMPRATLDFCRGRDRKWVWGRKDEEFVADFFLVTRRALRPAEYRLFKSHFLLGADCNLCCRTFCMDRPLFFQKIYEIEQKLGRILSELRPYSLYPLDEYYHGTRKRPVTSANVPYMEAA